MVRRQSLQWTGSCSTLTCRIPMTSGSQRSLQIQALKQGRRVEACRSKTHCPMRQVHRYNQDHRLRCSFFFDFFLDFFLDIFVDVFFEVFFVLDFFPAATLTLARRGCTSPPERRSVPLPLMRTCRNPSR